MPTAGPRTSAAPFRAVPSPELPGGPAGDGLPAAGPLEQAIRIPARSASPVLPRSASVWPDDEPVLVSTGPGLTASGARASGPAPRLPRQTTPAGAPSPAYGDWTKPSHPSEPLDVDLSADASGQIGLRVPVAPATSMIPERPVNRRRAAEHDDRVDSVAFAAPRCAAPRSDAFPVSDEYPLSDEFPVSEEFPARGPQSGPGTGPVGGRAAMRAERQAADMARRRAAKRSGAPADALDALEEEDGTRRRPRRVVMGLVAMTVVALGVLGVYSVISPETKEASAGTTATQSSAPSASSSAPVLPPLETGDLQLEIEATPATPVHAPVTVLNATEINGLAADVAAVIGAGGWETPGVGTYLAEDVAASTVFYTKGDETQHQAALSLVAQFPQLTATAERFFEVPADVAAPGLVVVLTAEWQP